MRSLVSSVGILGALSMLALGGCDFWQGSPPQRYYTYCDPTGCYTCTPEGCTPTGGNGTGVCKANTDCAEGCYCNSGKCTEAGFCDKDSDCSVGYVCDTSRHSCMPASGDGGNNAGNPDGGIGQSADASLPGAACTTDSNCPAGEYCESGHCTASFMCTKNADCGAGMNCDERKTCVPGPTTCARDTDCAAGAVCVSGQCKTTGDCMSDADCVKVGANLVCDGVRMTCVPSPVPGGMCKCDCDCGAGKQCTNGLCVAVLPNPNMGCTFNYECGSGQCVNNRCEAKCVNNAGCGTGDVCQNGFCVANPSPPDVTHGGCVYNVDCGPSKTCLNAACHTQCKVDADCTNPHDFCDSGLCSPDWRRVPQCKNNAGCSNGQECVNAVCRTHCWANADCGMCVGMPVCSMGYCTSQAELNPMCKTQADCAMGLSCVNATCSK